MTSPQTGPNREISVRAGNVGRAASSVGGPAVPPLTRGSPDDARTHQSSNLVWVCDGSGRLRSMLADLTARYNEMRASEAFKPVPR